MPSLSAPSSLVALLSTRWRWRFSIVCYIFYSRNILAPVLHVGPSRETVKNGCPLPFPDCRLVTTMEQLFFSPSRSNIKRCPSGCVLMLSKTFPFHPCHRNFLQGEKSELQASLSAPRGKMSQPQRRINWVGGELRRGEKRSGFAALCDLDLD